MGQAWLCLMIFCLNLLDRAVKLLQVSSSVVKFFSYFPDVMRHVSCAGTMPDKPGPRLSESEDIWKHLWTQLVLATPERRYNAAHYMLALDAAMLEPGTHIQCCMSCAGMQCMQRGVIMRANICSISLQYKFFWTFLVLTVITHRFLLNPPTCLKPAPAPAKNCTCKCRLPEKTPGWPVKYPSYAT